LIGHFYTSLSDLDVLCALDLLLGVNGEKDVLSYVMNMVRNLKNRDDATDERIIEYHEYVASYDKRDNLLWCFIAAAGFTVLSLALWLLT
jgi:hypothetical protein